MSVSEHTKALLAEDTPESFVALTRLLRGQAPGPDEKAALALLRTEAVPAEHLVRALVRSGAREHRYTEHAAPPFDYRSRLLVEDLLGAAGARRLEAARPLIVELLSHPDLSVWAAHALCAFDDGAAVDVAVQRLPELRGTARGVMFGFVLGRAPERVTEGDEGYTHDLLYALWRDVVDHGRTRAPWVLEPRFIALAERTRDSTASRELKAMLIDLLAAAGVKTKRVAKGAKSDPKLLERARREVAVVAKELPEVIEALRRDGYAFRGEPHLRPDRTVKSQLARLEREAGAPMPPTVRAFCERVGAVDLRGTHPSWPKEAETDPLVVAPLSTAFDDLEEHREGLAFMWRCVPEPLAKAGFSAGPGFGVTFGAGEYDPPLDGDPQGRRFLEHVKRALAQGGFGAPPRALRGPQGKR